MFRFLMKIACAGVFVVGAWSFGTGLIVPAKAYLSQVLIDRAWNAGGGRPWPWMDSVPVAKMSIPRLGWENVVMSGVSGEVMAFAPGWHEGSAPLGEDGDSVISAHRDTHFRVMRDIRVGDKIGVTLTNGGDVAYYSVVDLDVIDEPRLFLRSKNDLGNQLILTTCYPLESLQAGGQMRYVITAVQI